MIPIRRSPSSQTAPILCAAVLAALTIGHSQAASVTWDASGTSPNAPTDGAGLWSTSNANWAAGGTDSAWNNAANNDAVIGSGLSGTGSTITLTSNITVNSIKIGAAGATAYTISSTAGTTLTLTSGTFNAGTTVTLSANVTGTNGFTKAASNGTLVLNTGTNTYTGNTNILQATLQIRGASSLPTSTVVNIGNPSGSAAATLELRTANVTVAGIAAVGTVPTSNIITNAQFSGTSVLTVNPDGAGGAAADSTFAGVIKEAGGANFLALTKAGSHTLTLTGSNSYTGNTTVTAGTLLINGSLSGSSAVIVSGSGRLGGTGSIGSVSVSGTIGGGSNAIGTLNTNNLTLNSTATLENEFGRSGVTPTSDQINVTGTVSLASGANLQLTLTGLTPVNGDIFFLVNNDGTDAVTGVFTKLNGVTTTLTDLSTFSFNSQTYQITYFANSGSSSFSGGNDIAIQVVPEPATCALFGLSASAVLLLRRRRNL